MSTHTIRSTPAKRPLWGRWWRRQPPALQDRFATLGPLVSVLLFLAAILFAFWTLRSEEIERETDSVRRDTEITRQQIGQRLNENQQQMERLARELASRPQDTRNFNVQASIFLQDRAEISRVIWLDARRSLRAVEHSPNFRASEGTEAGPRHPDPSYPFEGSDSAAEAAFRSARELRRSVYSRAFNDVAGQPVYQLQVPILDRSTFTGVVVVEYAIDDLLRSSVPPDVSRRHLMSIVTDQEVALASTDQPSAAPTSRRASLVHDAVLTPAMNGLVLRGEGWRTSIGLIGNTLSWMVVALSILTLWMLLGAWRHMRRRAQIQNALLQETQFRRAMENSMLTGMRALDLDGR
ncbi:MAG: hypothetical protein RI949_1181, partial [Pseudomonadota bacterium]